MSESVPAKRLLTPWNLGLFGILVISLLVYWPSLGGLPIWDDHQILEYQRSGGDTLWKALSGHFLIYYRPFTGASYYLDSAILGRVAINYHATNVLIHALAAVVLAWAAAKMFRNMYAGLAAGLFFALQPAQVAATAWIGGRTDDLSCLWLALFIGMLLLQMERRSRWYSLSAALAFFCAVMTKEQNLPFLLLVPLAAIVYGKEKPAAALRSSIPCAVSGTLFLVLFVLAKSNAAHVASVPIGLEFERIGDSALHYALLFIVPSARGLTALSLGNYGSAASVLTGWAMLLTFVACTIWAWRVNRFAGFAMFAVLLGYLPVSNVVPIPSLIVAPYRVAVPGLFVAALLGYALVSAAQARRHWVTVAAVACFATGAFWTNAGIRFWMTEPGFYGEVARNDPHSLLADELNAQALLRKSDGAGALTWSEKCLNELFPGGEWKRRPDLANQVVSGSYAANLIEANDGTRTQPAALVRTALINRASALTLLHRDGEAIQSLRAALSLDPSSPEANFSMGKALLSVDRSEAVKRLELAAARKPDDWTYLQALARTRYSDGRYTEAAKLYRSAAGYAPWFGELSVGLADSLTAEKQYLGALAALDVAQHGMMMDAREIPERRNAIEKLMRRSLNGSDGARTGSFRPLGPRTQSLRRLG